MTAKKMTSSSSTLRRTVFVVAALCLCVFALTVAADQGNDQGNGNSQGEDDDDYSVNGHGNAHGHGPRPPPTELPSHIVQAWPSWGGNTFNTRSYDGKSLISPKNAHKLKVLNLVKLTGGVTVGPTTVGDGKIYFTDGSGKLHARRARNATSVLWTFDVTAFLVARGAVRQPLVPYSSRSAPAIDGDRVFISTQGDSYVIALNRHTGVVLWYRRMSTLAMAKITGSPRVYDGLVYIGTSSSEDQAMGAIPGYVLQFRGGFFALKASSGEIVWSFSSVPEGYFGGSVWSSEAPIDIKNKQIIIGVGNAYHLPPAVEACRVNQTLNFLTFRDPCREEADMSDSIVALSLKTGRIISRESRTAVESWNLACGIGLTRLGYVVPRNPGTCPQTPGPDADFGMSPILVKGRRGVTPNGTDAIFTGQKSGIVWAHRSSDLRPLWTNPAGPQGRGGGLMFGSTTNGTHYFYASANSESRTQTLINGQTIDSGHVGMLSLATGETIWQVPFKCFLYAALAHSNGLLYVPCGNMAGVVPSGGQLHILEAATGRELFNITGLPDRGSAVTVLGDRVYFPYGYSSTTVGGLYTLGL